MEHFMFQHEQPPFVVVQPEQTQLRMRKHNDFALRRAGVLYLLTHRSAMSIKVLLADPGMLAGVPLVAEFLQQVTQTCVSDVSNS